jgi:NAD(P)-dependent dehydrogenase (short-subunit alcohol dehydrogenase family)
MMTGGGGSLAGKTALVTGSGRGIGRAAALLLAREGAKVMLTARTASRLVEVRDAISASGGEAVLLAGDVTDEGFVKRLFDEVRATFGRLDLLVNNAGVAPFGPIEDFPVSTLRECLEVNVVGPFLCMQEAIRLMKSTGGRGRILNVGSVRSHWTEAGDAGVYNASKYALRGMTESVARQLHGTGLAISVGLICPGVTDTPLTNPGAEPRPGWLAPEDIARAILYAAQSPDGVNVFDVTVFSTAQKPW